MATDIICPDCGGLVGADPNDLRRKCTCNLNDTDHVAEPMGMPKVLKICCICGKDVSHEKRAKDSRGYWCYDCHKAERAREKASEGLKVPCHDCGRLVLPVALITFEGDKICGRCKEARAEKKKYRASAVGKHHEMHEKRQFILLALFALLLLLVILGHMYHWF
ncbi:MAG TPA: hypothetical protein VMD30_12475 [Tepidisphaeraceae bacterium]|nr:hypothetical protein [Tepidisphaeraceae bacterium]